jgi:hypothetical protein
MSPVIRSVRRATGIKMAEREKNAERKCSQPVMPA